MIKKKKEQLLAELDRLYPEPKSELNFKNEFELLIAVILSAQCTDKKVNEVTPSLFKRFPNFAVLAKARETEVEKIVRPINYYKTKSRNLVATACAVQNDWAGALP